MSAQCKHCGERLSPGMGWFHPECLVLLRERDHTIRYKRDVRPRSRTISVSKRTIKVQYIRVQTRRKTIRLPALD